METLRIALALIIMNKLKPLQVDVSTAYLHAKLDDEVYMEAIPGYPLPPGKVYRLFVDDSECDDRSNDQYIMNGQKKQSPNCGLSGRASGAWSTIYIYSSIYLPYLCPCRYV
mgnify:CR=1 FL=1